MKSIPLVALIALLSASSLSHGQTREFRCTGATIRSGSVMDFQVAFSERPALLTYTTQHALTLQPFTEVYPSKAGNDTFFAPAIDASKIEWCRAYNLGTDRWKDCFRIDRKAGVFEINTYKPGGDAERNAQGLCR